MSDSVRHREFMRITKAAAEHYNVSIEKVRGPSKLKFFYEPRRVAMLLMRELGASYPEIGRFFSRDHTTVIMAVRSVTEELSPVDIAAVRARVENKPTEGCHRCNSLMIELAALKLEILEMRARLNGCG